jgi:hypothetical protein
VIAREAAVIMLHTVSRPELVHDLADSSQESPAAHEL